MGSRSIAIASLLLAACGGPGPASPANVHDVDVPGIDTSGFTARERHEFSQYVQQLPAPCADVAVPVAQCVLDKRPCAACLPAAQAIAKAVREGMAREQVEDMYKTDFDPTSKHVIALDGSPTRGPADAPVVIVEFADFECPFCQKIAPELDELWEKHKGEVRFVYKFTPLKQHLHGDAAARAAIAALAQGRFWEMHHKLFANGTHLEQQDLEGYARAVGLDVPRFVADMQAPGTSARIAADKKLADDLGVHGTPTIYVNGREFDGKEDLEERIAREIAARKK